MSISGGILIKVNRKNILIVGGGIVGVSLAYFLNEKYKGSITLVDKKEIFSGASGINLGQISLIDRTPKIHLEWALKNNRILKKLQTKKGFSIEYEQSGGLLVLEDKEQKKAAEELIEKQNSLGLDIGYFEGKDVTKVEPMINHVIPYGFLYSPEEGRVNPLQLGLQLANEASSRGVNIHEKTSVIDFEVYGGKITRVKTKTGELSPDIIVLATGAWTGELAEKLNLSLPIGYHRGTGMVTAPVEKYLKNVIVSGGFLTAGERKKEQVIGLALAQHEHGEILLAQANKYKNEHSRKVSYKGVRGIAGKILRYFPSLQNLEVVRTWAGDTPYTDDGLPLFGFSNSYENLFIAAGLKGAFSTALAAGKTAADMIVSKRIPPEVKAFSPERGGKNE